MKKRGDLALFNSLNNDQKIIYLLGRIEEQGEQISELYELNRGALRTGDLSKKLLATATIIAALFTLGKGLEFIEHYFVAKNEEKVYVEKDKKEVST